MRNLPVVMLPLRQLSSGLGAKQIDGVIGTTLVYHLLATLDFAGGELILRRKDAESLRQIVAISDKPVAVRFWIAGDHFTVGWGRVERLSPSLLFLAVGSLAASVIKAAGIKLEEDPPGQGLAVR